MKDARSLDENRCTFTYADGRRCGMSRMEGHDLLCCHHWSRLEERDDAAKSGERIAQLVGEEVEPKGVKKALEELFRLVAQGRMPPARAMTLAYVSQLLLQALAFDLRREKVMSDIWEPYLQRLQRERLVMDLAAAGKSKGK